MAGKILTFNGKAISGPSGMVILDIPELPEPEAMTLRFQFSKKDYDPTGITSKGTWTKVQHPFNNIWDWTYDNADWSNVFKGALNDSTNIVDVIDAGDTSKVTNCEGLFNHYVSGGTNKDCYLRKCCLFDTSNVTNMKHMFYMCIILESIPLFNTSNVTNMNAMFYKCTALPSVPLFDLSNLEIATSLFRACSSLTDIPVFNTSKVTSMEGMFAETNLTSVPLLNTSSVTTMESMFYKCPALTSVPLFDTSNVTIMRRMFYECKALTSVPLFDTSSCENMYLMFSTCASLQTIPVFNISKAKNIHGMLNAMPSLTSIPTLDYSEVTDISILIGAGNELYFPLNIETLPDISTITTKLTNCQDAFKNAKNIKYGIIEAYNKLVSCNPTTYTNCFLNCGINTLEGHYQLNQIPTSWGGLLDSNHTVTIGDRVYRTITIGTQEWMVENLELDIEGSVWYNNDPTMKDKGYGKLYTVDMYNSFTPPAGWKKPDVSDFKTLQTYTEANNIDLRSIIGWSAVSPSDSIGFYGIPNGYCTDTGVFGGIGAQTSYWAGNSGHIANLTGIYDGSPFQALGMLVSRPGYYQTIRLVRDLV